LKKEVRIQCSFSTEQLAELFYLFLPKSFISKITIWLKTAILVLSEGGVMIYIALEMAMSIVKINSIEYYWKVECFLAM